MAETGPWNDVSGALARIPSGLFLLSTRDGERDRVILVSWVQQAGFEPPSLTVCLRKDRPIAEHVRSYGSFALSTLGDDQPDLVARFSRGVPDHADPFQDLFILRTPSGCAVLQEAVAGLDCRVTAETASGDHVVFVAEVVGGMLLREAKPWVHIRKDGLRY